MVQKIHPRGVIWVPISRLMWADQLKKIGSSSVHILRSPCPTPASMLMIKLNGRSKEIISDPYGDKY